MNMKALIQARGVAEALLAIEPLINKLLEADGTDIDAGGQLIAVKVEPSSSPAERGRGY